MRSGWWGSFKGNFCENGRRDDLTESYKERGVKKGSVKDFN